jgi:membrane protein DedA with SNARE-associated domain
MSFETIIQHYGYVALFVGTFLEGETVLILAGFAAHRGYLELPMVWLVALLGGFAGDQFFFFLGRLKGKTLLEKKTSWRPRIARANELIARYKVWVIFGLRFFYGMRIAGPFAVGISDIKTAVFVLINLVSALIWALIFGTGGYLFGSALESIFGNIERYEKYIFIAALAVWALAFLVSAALKKKGDIEDDGI